MKLVWDTQLGISILPNHNRYLTILYYYRINRIPNSILQIPSQLHTLENVNIYTDICFISHLNHILWIRIGKFLAQSYGIICILHGSVKIFCPKEVFFHVTSYIHHLLPLRRTRCAVLLETRRSRVQSPPRSATFFRGD